MRVPIPAAMAMAANLLSCLPSQTIQASDVLTLSACPSDAGVPCQLRADGVSLVTIQACVPSSVAQPLASGLSVTLQASAGAWQLPTSAAAPSIYTVSLSSGGCVEPILVAPSATLSIDVVASFSGYSQSVTIPLTSAELRSVEITAVPATLGTVTPNELALSATVLAKGLGVPTAGTTVSFAPIATPASAYVAVWPTTSIINASGQATATLIVGPGAQSVAVTATASGPPSASGIPAPMASGSIQINYFPVDAGVMTDAAAE